MIAPFLILHLAHARELKLFCVGGFLFGCATLLYGIRPRTHRTSIHSSPPNSSSGNPLSNYPNPQHVIQLSSVSTPTRSADMTQQQKIAAALTRAGMTELARNPEPSAVTVESPELDTPELISGSRDTLLIGSGLVLMLFTLVAFLIIR